MKVAAMFEVEEGDLDVELRAADNAASVALERSCRIGVDITQSGIARRRTVLYNLNIAKPK